MDNTLEKHPAKPEYIEQVRLPGLSAGTYTIPAGAEDPQKPHTEDEVYLVLRGRGHFDGPAGRQAVEKGNLLVVPRGEPHRFVDVVEELEVFVCFGPPESTT